MKFASTSEAFVLRPARFVRNERAGSGRPGDVRARLVAARDAGRDRLVQVRRELRKRGREIVDGVADRSRHVEARLLRWRAGPPRLAAEARRPRELLEQRLALGCCASRAASTSCLASASSSSSSRSARRFRYCRRASRSSMGPASPIGTGSSLGAAMSERASTGARGRETSSRRCHSPFMSGTWTLVPLKAMCQTPPSGRSVALAWVRRATSARAAPRFPERSLRRGSRGRSAAPLARAWTPSKARLALLSRAPARAGFAASSRGWCQR